MRRALLAAALALAACGDPPAPRALADGPRRIVSLAPSITETVYALGAEDRLVGVCAQCDFPEAAAKLPRVGGYMVPSVEAVIAARPDVVLVVPSPGNRDAVRAIAQAGVRVVVVADRTLADLWAAIRTIAGTLEMAEAGERLVRDVEGRLGTVRSRVAGLPARRVLLVVDHRPLVVAGAGTLQDELVTLAGGTNVAADIGSVWPELSLEVIVARAPEVIVDATVVMRADEVKDFFAGLTTVPAVRTGRVITLNSEAILRAGPRVPEAAAALAAAIHPEAFAAG
jgi:iron complex transport system substrate-binding protein